MNTENTLYNISEIEVSYKTKVKAAYRHKVNVSKDTADICRSLYKDGTIEWREEMTMLCLNRQNQVLGYFRLSAGGTAGTVMDTKIIFQIALNCNASGIILSHNHPSGETKPSDTDIRLTKQIQQAGKLLEIKVLDHIILTEDSFYSLADEGQM